MWHVKTLIAVDDDGNIVEIDDDYVTVTVTLSDTNIKVTRGFLLDETPPCLSIAIDDLINFIAD